MNDRPDTDDDATDDEPWCEHMLDRVGDHCRQCERELAEDAATEARTEGYRF